MDERAKWSLDAEQTRGVFPQTIVAVPVCNEQDGITACLDAFAAQVGLDSGSFGIVLFLNNCTDRTAQIVRDYVGMPWPMRVVTRLHPEASAGWARRTAMEAASRWLAESGLKDGVLLTTDADSRVSSDWVARNVATLRAGAHAVAGRIRLDADDAARLPEHLHARGRLESDYEKLLTEIDARLDPQPGNPWPCHWSKSGATIGVRWSTYKHVGGMPDMPTGEDRAFVDAIRAHDFIVRHAPDIEVITSGRLEGRAAGGVADTMKLRCNAPETPCDVRLERLARVIARALVRRHIRSLQARRRLDSSLLWRPLGIPRESVRKLATQGIGKVLAEIELASPRMDYRPVRPSELPRQIGRARVALRLLRWLTPAAGRAAGSRSALIDVWSPAKVSAFSNIDAGTPDAPSI